jgi:lysozyme
VTAEELIKRHEGLRLRPYRDSVGILTVGYGHNLEATGEPIPAFITEQKAQEYFLADYAKAMNACMVTVPGFPTLGDPRRGVMIDMAFNLGQAGLARFRKMLACIGRQDWPGAAREMIDSKWARQVGIRATENVFMMLTGEWL